jgi:uncharacterized protein
MQRQPWGFYGRQQELEALESILRRGRWFFVKITGRRRIGKTSLVQKQGYIPQDLNDLTRGL